MFKTVDGELKVFNKTILSTQNNLKNLQTQTANLSYYTTSGNHVNLQNVPIAQPQTVSNFTKLNNAFKVYNGNLTKSTELQNSYIKSVGGQNQALGNYLAGLNGAKASMGGYIISLGAATLKTIGLQAASIALNATLTMGISFAIQGIISGIDYIIHRNEKLIESANEMTQTYREQSKTLNDNIKSLQGQKDEFERLSKGVDDYGKNISLSSDEYDRYKSIVEEILGYSPELIAGYDEEGNAIAKKNGLIERSIELMKEEQRQKLKEMTTDEKTKTAYKGAKAEYDDAKNARSKLRFADNVVSSTFLNNNGDSYSGSYLTMQHLQSILPTITGEV